MKRAVLALCCALAAAAFGADTAVLAPSADASIYSENVNNGNGGGQFFFVGKNSSGGLRRALVLFDVAGGLPPGAEITAASLAVSVGNTQGTGNVATLHPVTEAWLEGTTDATGSEGSGAAAALNDTTWNSRNFNTVAWTTPGGSHNNGVADSISITGTGAYAWPSSASLVATLQGWLDAPATNLGWIILGDETTAGATAKQISSRQGATPPALTITYLLASYDPALTVAVDAQASINVGQAIDYDLQISADLVNGDGSDVSGLSVTGSLSGAAAYAAGDTNNDTLLQSGETWIFTGSYTALASDPNTLQNFFTLAFDDERGDLHTESASASTTVNHLTVSLASIATVNAASGDTVAFGVSASGGYGNYDYAWTFDDGGGPAPLGAPNNATLTLSNVTFSQAGTYACIVSDIEEEAVSAPFTLNVAAQTPALGMLGLAAVSFVLAAAAHRSATRDRRGGIGSISTRSGC